MATSSAGVRWFLGFVAAGIVVVEALELVGPVVVEAGAEIVKTQFFTFAIFFHRPNISFLFSLCLALAPPVLLLSNGSSRAAAVCIGSPHSFVLPQALARSCCCCCVPLLPSPLMVVRLLLVLVVQ